MVLVRPVPSQRHQAVVLWIVNASHKVEMTFDDTLWQVAEKNDFKSVNFNTR